MSSNFGGNPINLTDLMAKIRRIEIELNKIPGILRDIAALEASDTIIEVTASDSFLNDIIRTNAQTTTEDITLPAAFNGVSAGPITIGTGLTVTIETGATWTIV